MKKLGLFSLLALAGTIGSSMHEFEVPRRKHQKHESTISKEERKKRTKAKKSAKKQRKK